MSEIPVDVQSLMAEFWVAQKEQAARKALEKQQFSKKQVETVPHKPMKPKEAIRYARDFGFSIGSGGNHGVHLVAPNGLECPLPTHGGGKTLANGTQRSIIGFIQQNGQCRG